MKTSSAYPIVFRAHYLQLCDSCCRPFPFRSVPLSVLLLAAQLVMAADLLADENKSDLPCLGRCDTQEQQAETEQAIAKLIYKGLENSRRSGEKILVLGIGRAAQELGYDPQLIREYIADKTTVHYGNGSLRLRDKGIGWRHQDALTPDLTYKGQLQKDRMEIGFEFRF